MIRSRESLVNSSCNMTRSNMLDGENEEEEEDVVDSDADDDAVDGGM